MHCSLFLIIFATIFFTPITFKPETYSLNLELFSWLGTVDNIDQFIVEKIANVLLFIPLGFTIPTVCKRMRKWYATLSVSFAITFSIECMQYFIGRSSDIDDLITNLCGAIIGYLAFTALNRFFHHKTWLKKLLNN